MYCHRANVPIYTLEIVRHSSRFGTRDSYYIKVYLIMPLKTPRTRRRSNHKRLGWYWLFFLVLVALAVPASAYVLYLDNTVRAQFEGKRWALPARVYARPLELFEGMRLAPETLAAELTDLGYVSAKSSERPGTYTSLEDGFRFVTRAFNFWDTVELSLPVRVQFEGGQLAKLEHGGNGRALSLVRLQPLLIGSIYPAHNEDRVLVQLKEVPPMLIQALIAMEDQRYYQHHGIDPLSIARAFWANLRAGGIVQGGSTLSQQLVKNFYLTSDRTFTRKINEAIMALLLDAHYSKDEILEAYLNEIFLGQEGARAIHGFGLASHFYFGRPLNELELSQLALLVGLVPGASYYDPRRYPERVLARRNIVLNTLAARNVINTEEAQSAMSAPLGVTAKAPAGSSPYPAFLDLVRRQLQRDYQEQDLTSEGLQIFTTLDPRVQDSVERALAAHSGELEKQNELPAGQLQGAAIITNSGNGEILAVAGGREARFSGFNRALDARRPIGSLVKPAVYLAALARPEQYTLATLLDDGPVTVKNPGGRPWTPQNYDRQSHGYVPLHTALAKSYNLSTAHLGLALGVPEVLATLQHLGITREFPAYPSSLLGAIDLSPLEVTQMYHTLASGGFRVPLRAIRDVLTSRGEPLQRYELSMKQAFDPAPVFLLTTAMQEVVQSGTARSLYQQIPETLAVAGKTGTTDDLRDSWFAGFSGEHVAVVWLGRDNNLPTGLTGSSGALKVWGNIMQHIDTRPLRPSRPPDIEYVRISAGTQQRIDNECRDAIHGPVIDLPFIKGSAPIATIPCGNRMAGPSRSRNNENPFEWLREIFQ